jgi:hypothetical protein
MQKENATFGMLRMEFKSSVPILFLTVGMAKCFREVPVKDVLIVYGDLLINGPL